MGDSIKKLAIFGSTGSIGRQTLQVVRNLTGRFRVVGLAAGQNLELLSEQIAEFQPKYIYYQSKESSKFITHSGTFLPMEEIAGHPDVDIVVIATSGKAGLSATLAAVRAGKKVAIANKEPLVMAGEIITREAKKSGAQLLPIDSEHSAIWQCLNGESQPPKRILLTASGGPFRGFSQEQLNQVTPQQALKHPSWQMGKKVTIDSATLMNKGLEIMEARWLFNIPLAQIDVIIHPQSIIHSMVEFIDGSFKAQMSFPDMRLPIQYALTWPERVPNPELPKLDWAQIKSLTFEPPDYKMFPCLELAIKAAKTGGTAPTALCAADETAVDLFLQGAVNFTDIARIVAGVMTEHQNICDPALDDIMNIDRWARDKALKLFRQDKKC
ncbi:MAG TPA: 1-deoxy-D-xylulose-5-phosphate reductoisomerase [Dehalococcoidales bacterium]|jgi:1-deoxy-D-xylulose-5-phosphate reductoisomerase|nr:1-deoxy-D-xylulose-5-phosphate reductoisomerase [Dehalococcoidales bacterium]